jgi:prevent-host-death family protein
MPKNAHWQIQEAKQRFSEYLRAVQQEGPQIVTKHGEEIAITIDIAQWRKMTTPTKDLRELLLGPPYFNDTMIEIMEEIEAERKTSFAPLRDFEIELGLTDEDRPR